MNDEKKKYRIHIEGFKRTIDFLDDRETNYEKLVYTALKEDSSAWNALLSIRFDMENKFSNYTIYSVEIIPDENPA